LRFGITFGFITPPGSGVTWADTARDLIEGAPEIEALGYDSLHCIEHHFQGDGHNPSPLITLAAAAALTERVRLCTNILLAPLYNPVKLAEDVAVLDNLSAGRVTLGVAPGYVSEEFAGLMVPYAERFGRFEETLDVLQAAWTNDSFSYDGRYFRIPETRLSPKPVQDPHPPLWYGVSGPRLLRLAARRRCTLSASPRHTLSELQEHFAAYVAHAQELGFTPTERPVMREVFVAETKDRAEELAAPAVTHLFRELYGRKSAEGERPLRSDDGVVVRDMEQVDFETFKGRYIIGTPDDACARIAELRDDLGATEIVSWMHLPGIRREHAMESVRLFARDVIPAFNGTRDGQ
jgi:alkanesulfonate monooxygenase SsuD/methylene tetrahydromethanopterin reductase-like flavin-dependent oxidoreductase (luciferase family)